MNKSGLLESVLRTRFGEPTVVNVGSLSEYRWNELDDANSAILFKGTDHEVAASSNLSDLGDLYGDCIGGYLLKNVLTIPMISGPKQFGIYQMHDFRLLPHVQRASIIDPNICYFMTAVNVWFFGKKENTLFMYDSETEELSVVGVLEVGLQQVLSEWLDARV